MSELYELEQIADRAKFPSEPDATPAGYRLQKRCLPGLRFGSLLYAHVSEITDTGEVIPSPVEAVDKETGRVLCAGTIIVVDISVEPPLVVKVVGQFVENGDSVSYVPKRFR
jgi:hypothetical protein